MSPQVNLVQVELERRLRAQDTLKDELLLKLLLVVVVAVTQNIRLAVVLVAHVVDCLRNALNDLVAVKTGEFLRIAPSWFLIDILKR